MPLRYCDDERMSGQSTGLMRNKLSAHLTGALTTVGVPGSGTPAFTTPPPSRLRFLGTETRHGSPT